MPTVSPVGISYAYRFAFFIPSLKKVFGKGRFDRVLYDSAEFARTEDAFFRCLRKAIERFFG